MHKRLMFPGLICAMALLVSLASCSYGPFLWRNVPPDVSLYSRADMEFGGQLYDNWYKIKTQVKWEKRNAVKFPPTGKVNPLYPRTVKAANVGESWRCKKCHGWDYLGVSWPAGKKSKAFQGPALLNLQQKSPEQVFLSISSGRPGHDFGNYLSEMELWALTRFLREGLVDSRKLLTGDNRFKGDASKGAALYASKCEVCHGADGDLIDFRSKRDGIQGVGWRSIANPQLTLHRVSWGVWYNKTSKKLHVIMPAARGELGLSSQQVVDVLAYAQTLGTSQ